MWRRTYLTLVLIRLWFALSPSYLHPDENFQGPEVIAGTLLTPGGIWGPRRTAERSPKHQCGAIQMDAFPIYLHATFVLLGILSLTIEIRTNL